VKGTQDFQDFTAFPIVNGLSKRELFAAMAMQGLAANGGFISAFNAESIVEVAIRSVLMADKLISCLDYTCPEEK
jgi:hypothetical protein